MPTAAAPNLPDQSFLASFNAVLHVNMGTSLFASALAISHSGLPEEQMTASGFVIGGAISGENRVDRLRSYIVGGFGEEICDRNSSEQAQF